MMIKDLIDKKTAFLSKFHGASLAVLWTILVVHLYRWGTVYSSYLFDKNLQNDDARILLFPFWSFSDNPEIANDPVVQEQLGVILTSYQLLYRLLVNFTDVLGAAKATQLICIALVFWGGYILWRSKRTGLATAVLFIVLFLSTPFFLNRIAGGLPRGFAFPCMALWAAGAMTHKERVRLVAMVLAGLFYPPVMVLLLGAEGVWALRGLSQMGRTLFFKRARRYALAITICFAFFMPNYLMNDRSERMHTYEEALQNPAFKKGGRLVGKEQVPFTDPAPIWGRSVTRFFAPSGRAVFPQTKDWLRSHHATFSLLSISLILALLFFGFLRFPSVGISILISSWVCYGVARVVAFLLYTPLRYLEFGTVLGVFITFVEVVGFAFYGSGIKHRKVLRNIVAAAALLFMFLFLGDGFNPKTGMTIDYKKREALWKSIETLPTDSRILAHPRDADSVALFGKRGTTITFELLVPWFVERWDRHQKRIKDIFSTLYATDQNEFLKLCEKQKITHILKSSRRYGKNFNKKVQLFTPLNQQVKRLLRGTKHSELVLLKVPSKAIVARHGFELISVQKLKESWAATGVVGP